MQNQHLGIGTAAMEKNAKSIIVELLKGAGININGSAPWDPQVHNEQLYARLISEGTLGAGEAYMDKWWDCQQLDIFFEKVFRAEVDREMKIPLHYKFKLLLAKFFSLQNKYRAQQVAHQHYDLGNSLFSAMLDKYMMYSCGYWKTADTLDAAQTAKLDLICQKLQLQAGQRLLDIGCGWGGLAKFAAENYGVNVVGITISQQQCQHAQEYCKGLPVEIRLLDYRDLNEKFDRIVSVGMFEHVGHLNYHTFMETTYRILADDGLFLLHTIGLNETSFLTNPWIEKYIFPNSMLPSIAQIGKAAEKLFVMEDWQNFGAYYDNTLMAWYENFLQHWPDLKNQYDERFYRMWTYYLLSSAGTFRGRIAQLWQIVFSKGREGVYIAPR